MPRALVLLLLLCACREPVDITRDTRLSGRIRATTVDVHAGATVTFDADLILDATGDVTIDGDLEGAPDTGASIDIVSLQGSIAVNGTIETPDGQLGADDQDHPSAQGQVGGNGGDISLSAPSGDVAVRGTLTAGDGGNGGNATAQGPGPTLSARSGAGGRGGHVILSAGGTLEVASGAVTAVQVTAGDGGEGGLSEASLQGGATGDAATSAHAVSASGAPGGDVTLRLESGGAEIMVQLGVGSGAGGATNRARANGALETTAECALPGKGGDVKIELDDITLLTLHTAPELGAGGDNGLIIDANGHAIARALFDATASVTVGGAPGAHYEQGVKINEGEAGSTGNSRAQVNPPEVIGPGDWNNGSQPGPASSAHDNG